MSGPPQTPSETEERHDSLGARRTLGGLGGHVGPPQTPSETEERHDSLGARRTLGGLGGHVGAPHRRRVKPRSATIHSGRDERWGVWGAISGPPTGAE